jgi:hypothetical protein
MIKYRRFGYEPGHSHPGFADPDLPAVTSMMSGIRGLLSEI